MRLPQSFYSRDVLEIAPDLLGKVLVRDFGNGEELRLMITETEAYRGEDDLACHASKGRTPRTEVMYLEGGKIYVYLIYGMYWLLNFVTGPDNHPQAVLIRGCEGVNGPGRLGKVLRLDRSFYGENLVTSDRIWVEDATVSVGLPIGRSPRVGIDYAGDHWANVHWRFTLGDTIPSKPLSRASSAKKRG
ncbi:MAG: DNA-3-methyladenine glycosylase [Breznakibacter sp.]